MAWRCSVCGYVHRGPEPPEMCPVCGSSRDQFEPFSEAPVVAPSPARRWRCLNCLYVHEGGVPPDACPVCNAAADRFQPADDASVFSVHPGGRKAKVVVIGGGIAGLSAIEAVREAAPEAEIVLISKEPERPYYRLNLTRYLAGEVDRNSLPIHPEAWYAEQRIGLRLGVEVAALDLDGRRVTFSSGGAEDFEKLIVATGAHPFMPPIPGASKEGVMTVRTTIDADRVIETVQPGVRCVCIGGGLLGLESAGGIARRGASVTVLEGFPQLLPRQLNPPAAAILERFLTGLGIVPRTAAKVEEFVGDERVCGVRLADGVVLPADLVLVTAGVRPNSCLARQAGLEVNQGILVDDHLRASHPDVFAAGDVAEHRGVLYGTWSPSHYQGAIAGMNAAGVETEFGGIPRSNTLKVLGLDLFSIGVIVPEDGSYQVIDEESGDQYFRFVFRDSHLVGAILLGDASRAAAAKTAVEGKADFSGLLAKHPTAPDVLDFLA